LSPGFTLRPASSRDKETFIPEITGPLGDAILWFLATCAIRRFRGHADQHMTMLVHSSQYVAQHEHMARVIGASINENARNLVDGTGEISNRFDELINDERGRTAPEDMEEIPETVDDVHRLLPEVLDALELAVENGVSETRLDYDSGPRTYIVVGGTVLGPVEIHLEFITAAPT